MTLRNVGTAVAILAITLFGFFVYPNHTYLQSDTQIYVPVIEWLADPSLYLNDQIPRGAHVSLTIYDEVTRLFQLFTGDVQHALQFQQLIYRACGVAGLFLIATSAGLATVPALIVAALSSLGAAIAGPAILTVEYEPVPRGFAIGLTMLALGFIAHQRYWPAGIAAALAFLYHAPAVWPFWLAIFLFVRRRELLLPLGAAIAILIVLAIPQTGIAERQHLFAILTPEHAAIQKVRASYIWVSIWFTQHIWFYAASALVLIAADRRLKSVISPTLRKLILTKSIIGVLTMPASYLFLETLHWALMPQLQPMRALLFPIQFAILLAAIAVFTVRPLWARALWLTIVLIYPFLHGGQAPKKIETPQLAELSEWARNNTDKDAVFLFPDEGRSSLPPGIFRARALRAVYTDWKAGGQVNYFPHYAGVWWKRWNEAIVTPFHEGRVPVLAGLGVNYLVLSRSTLPEKPVWSNSTYSVYRIQ